MPYKTGSWGQQAKERSRRRHAYFIARKKAMDPRKISARNKVFHAIKTGKLVRPEVCENCGRQTRLQGHHDDYDKPLDVKFYCGRCHRLLH